MQFVEVLTWMFSEKLPILPTVPILSHPTYHLLLNVIRHTDEKFSPLDFINKKLIWKRGKSNILEEIYDFSSHKPGDSTSWEYQQRRTLFSRYLFKR